MGMVKVLIVDDDLQIIRTIGNAFTTLILAYQLFTATTANQGLNYIKQEKLDTIKKHASEIQAFLTELREISEAKP